MKKILYSALISIITVFVFSMNVYGFENDIYKMDIPSEFKETSQGESSAFVKSNNEGILVFSVKSSGLKKNISTMSKSEINDLVNKLVGYKTEIISQGKDKLGKSKAIKARLKSISSERYMDIYIVVSDQHVLLIAFVTETASELDSKEILDIKKSFVMKEKTTNVTLIRILEFVIIAGGIGFGIYRKVRK